MKAATIKEIRAELSTLHPDMLVELCLNLTRYRKENKELLSYLLFEAHDEPMYIKQIKELMDGEFENLAKGNLYLAKKSVRRILRTTSRYVKYSKSKQTEVELLLYFCKKLKGSGLPINANTVIGNIYLRQCLKIKKTLATLHEDLQYDYMEEVRRL